MKKVMQMNLLFIICSSINGMDKKIDKIGLRKTITTGHNTNSKATLKNIHSEELFVMGDDRQKSIDCRIFLPIIQHSRLETYQNETGFIAFTEIYFGKRK